MSNNLKDIPLEQYFDLKGFIPANFVQNSLEKYSKNVKNILIIGDYSARDYYLSKTNFPKAKIVVIDLFKNKRIASSDLIISDIQKVKLKENYYDAIIVMGVIEHLENDFYVLKKLRHALNKNGILIANVPLIEDMMEDHINIYTPHSFDKTLKICGFEKIKAMHSGFLLNRYFCKLTKEVQKLLVKLKIDCFPKLRFSRVIYRFNECICNFNLLCYILNRNIFYKNSLYNYYYVGKKSKLINSININKKKYSKS